MPRALQTFAHGRRVYQEGETYPSDDPTVSNCPAMFATDKPKRPKRKESEAESGGDHD